MYGLIFSKLFDEDIDSTYQYIKSNLEAPMAAENLLKEVKQKIRLVRFLYNKRDWISILREK